MMFIQISSHIEKAARFKASLPKPSLFSGTQCPSFPAVAGMSHFVENPDENDDVTEMSIRMVNAVKKGKIRTVEDLLDAGEDIRRATVDWGIDRHSILQLAVQYHRHDLVWMLLNRYSLNVSDGFHSNGKAPIHMACSHGDAAMVELLLHYGADIEAKTDCLMTPLHVAIYWAHPTVVRLLLLKGSDLYGRTCWRDNDCSIMCNAASSKDIAFNRDGFHTRTAVRNLVTAEHSARACAFMMGQHPRLGEHSLLSLLEPEIARAIYSQIR